MRQRTDSLNRRVWLLLCACAPVDAWAQGAAPVRRIGTLSGRASPKAPGEPLWPAFFDAMRGLGYEEGRNVVYEMRHAEGVSARFPQLAQELVAARVDVIVITGSSEAVAASRATSTIPIVAIHVGDPESLGLAHSLARPGRNLTGSTLYIPGFHAKALELLLEAVPRARRIAVLGNPTQPNLAENRVDMERVATAKGATLLPMFEAKRPEELEPALERITKARPDALMVLGHALFILHRQRVVEFAAQSRLPTMHGYTDDVEAGGLMAYAVETRPLYARAAVFVDKILKGEKPGDIPIEQPTRFGLWVNLNTARSLGLKPPQAILIRAERVIE